MYIGKQRAALIEWNFFFEQLIIRRRSTWDDVLCHQCHDNDETKATAGIIDVYYVRDAIKPMFFANLPPRFEVTIYTSRYSEDFVAIREMY